MKKTNFRFRVNKSIGILAIAVTLAKLWHEGHDQNIHANIANIAIKI